jgi:hypothetical protein
VQRNLFRRRSLAAAGERDKSDAILALSGIQKLRLRIPSCLLAG